jgi:hypothetical protein
MYAPTVTFTVLATASYILTKKNSSTNFGWGWLNALAWIGLLFALTIFLAVLLAGCFKFPHPKRYFVTVTIFMGIVAFISLLFFLALPFGNFLISDVSFTTASAFFWISAAVSVVRCLKVHQPHRNTTGVLEQQVLAAGTVNSHETPIVLLSDNEDYRYEDEVIGDEEVPEINQSEGEEEESINMGKDNLYISAHDQEDLQMSNQKSNEFMYGREVFADGDAPEKLLCEEEQEEQVQLDQKEPENGL